MNDRLFTLFALILLGIVICGSTTAWAQGRQDQDEDDTPHLIAVLDVPGGGTDALAAAIETIDDVKVERQDWFLAQVQSRGFAAQGIMTRPDDLKWLMKGAKLNYILYLAPEEEATYHARLVSDEAGEVVLEFDADRSEDGLTASAARAAGREVSDYFESIKPPDLEAEERARQAAEAARKKQEEADNPNVLKEKQAKERASAREVFSRDWLRISARGVGLRRDLAVAGENRAVMAYSSAFYPGFALSAEAFPLGMSNQEYGGIGFYINYTQGFDSVTVLDVENNETPISILHFELEGGVLYQLGDPLRVRTSDEARVAVGVGVRHMNLGAEANPILPSLSHTSFVLTSRVYRNLFSEVASLDAGFAVYPFGIYGTGAELFGNGAYSYGAGGDLGVVIHATPDIGILAGYELRLQRTSFSGSGELDFEEANAFELVQGLSAGVRYEY